MMYFGRLSHYYGCNTHTPTYFILIKLDNFCFSRIRGFAFFKARKERKRARRRGERRKSIISGHTVKIYC